jgi:hypothetical protein
MIIHSFNYLLSRFSSFLYLAFVSSCSRLYHALIIVVNKERHVFLIETIPLYYIKEVVPEKFLYKIR